MAAMKIWRRLLHNLSVLERRQFLLPKNYVKLILFGTAGCGSIVALSSLISGTYKPIQSVFAAKNEDSDGKVKKIEVPYREMRFRHFASVEFNGSLYMTPQDFLESLTEESPRARIGRTRLSQSDVDSMLRSTPSLSRGNEKLFRKLHDRGIISYTEYLFLLCVLTKPHSGFRIAFNMFDLDGNQIVDKEEFLVLETFFALPPKERKFVPRNPQRLHNLLDLENVFSSGSKQAEAARDGKDAEDARSTDSKDYQENPKEIQDTTLLVHFFGRSGKDVLKYQDFHRFMENLQSEVIELEFLEFSKGMSTISEVSFAKILLRYTSLDRSDVEECLERVRKRMPNEKGITFVEFKKFCQFLNNLDDFAIAMKMYTYAQQPVSQEEFQRAVLVCTGFSLGSHIVNTLFNIFDTDGDGNLSHKEFISIMKDRLHRGARSHLMHNQNTLDAFKTCVKNEMRTF
ncbi:hypothetical protein BsWGS_17806 [Bradybaena similaris]